MEEITQPRDAVGAATIAEAFRITAADRADEVAVRTKGDEIAWTWGELRERVDALAAGLAGLGLERGDTVALLFGNRPEFHLSDLAVVTAGGTPFSIYMQYGPEQIRYVVSDAGARMIITEQQFLPNVLEARKELPDLEHVIVIDGDAPEGVLTLDEVIAAPDPGFDAEASVAQLGPAGPAHDHLHLGHHGAAQGRPALAPQPAGRRRAGRAAHRLPARRARHLLAARRPRGRAQRPPLPADRLRAADHVLRQPARDPRLPARGPALVVLRRPAHLGEAEGRPRGDGRRPARRAARTRRRPRCATRSRRSASSRPARRCPPTSPSAWREADREIFAGLRAMLGLDQVKAIHVGAAPTPVEVLEFFHAIGLPLAELWGMSETCGAGAANPPEKIKIGTVGPPAPGRRDEARRRRRAAHPQRRRDARLPQPAREDRRGDDRGRLPAHRRHRRSSTRTAT